MIRPRSGRLNLGRPFKAGLWSFYIYQEIWRSIILNFRIWARAGSA